ncbi:MAG: hypothetical protein OEY85_07690 [Rhodospirillales bacterium]|nr:hypothetical protein [Rhodospirillales bacterium]
MFLGEGLVEAGLIRPEDVQKALEHQKTSGGTLGESLVSLNMISVEQLESFFNFSVRSIKSIEDTGLDFNFLMTLVLKIISVYDFETPSQVSHEIKLPMSIVSDLMDSARERGLLEALGAATQGVRSELRFTVSKAGREWVEEAMSQSMYVGPAPVSLDDFQIQTEKQRISYDRVDLNSLKNCLSHLILPDEIIQRLGPALNFGGSLLLYGAPGNGKTSIALALARSFQQFIYVPYAIEVSGQVIKVYDPEIHTEVEIAGGIGRGERTDKLRRNIADKRWVRCRRPTAITGGELTLEMLDLNFNPYTRFYEAPLQVKAIGGVFLIDDFGRQQARPEQILNRWVVPLERGYDYLTLHTGKKFPIRFDGLVIFSTNLPPRTVLDAAMMRRIPHNYLIGPPSKEEYVTIFKDVCSSSGLKYSEDIVDMLMKDVYEKGTIPLARFHPRFIVDHAFAQCRFMGTPAELTLELALDAIQHLFTKVDEGEETWS